MNTLVTNTLVTNTPVTNTPGAPKAVVSKLHPTLPALPEVIMRRMDDRLSRCTGGSDRAWKGRAIRRPAAAV